MKVNLYQVSVPYVAKDGTTKKARRYYIENGNVSIQIDVKFPKTKAGNVSRDVYRLDDWAADDVREAQEKEAK